MLVLMGSDSRAAEQRDERAPLHVGHGASCSRAEANERRAWPSLAVAPHSNRDSADDGLRYRETGFRGRRKSANTPPELQISGLRDQTVVQKARHFGTRLPFLRIDRHRKSICKGGMIRGMGMPGAPSSAVIRRINPKLRAWRPIEPIPLPMRPMNGEPLPGSAGQGGSMGGFMHPSRPVAAYSAALLLAAKTSERALYYVLGNGQAVRYPVGVGRVGKQWTGTARISGKYLKPAWSPPDEVKRDKPSLPDVIPGGSPSNPMGAAAMTISGGGEYAIHGTNNPASVGGFVSYGCIRMYNADVLDLYNRVSWGAPVVVTR